MTRWSTGVKALHWTLLVAILIEVPVGFLMSATYGPSLQDPRIAPIHVLASQLHHTAGFVILTAGIAWIAIRLRTRRPQLPADMPRWQRGLARVVQASLMVLLILIPWSGWTALSALADSASFGVTHIWMFGFDDFVPRIWPPLPATDPAGYARFARWHGWLLRAGLILVALHTGSALWHQFIHRDGLLGRIWPRLDDRS
jgi:cytochrome b561